MEGGFAVLRRVWMPPGLPGDDRVPPDSPLPSDAAVASRPKIALGFGGGCV